MMGYISITNGVAWPLAV